MILYEWTMPEDSKYDHAILRFNNKSEVSDNFKMSKVSFLAVELLIKTNDGKEAKYSIDFKKDNFYIENNIHHVNPLYYISAKLIVSLASCSVLIFLYVFHLPCNFVLPRSVGRNGVGDGKQDNRE